LFFVSLAIDNECRLFHSTTTKEMMYPLWGGLPRLPHYMAPATDPWAPGGVTYQFAEVAPPGGGTIDSSNVVFTAHTIGANSNNDSGSPWNGQAPPGDDDLGNSTLIGCTFGPNTGVANPC
jgi:hypothetical protein